MPNLLTMPPSRKRARTTTTTGGGASSSSATAAATACTLGGGYAQPARTVEKFRDGRLTDVTLEAADGTTFHAHALCLTAGSEYFEALHAAASSWKDAADETLALSSVPAHALEVCLEFIYVGEATATEAQLWDVLEAAAYLQMPELVEATTKALARRLTPSTVLRTWEVADRQGLSVLADEACHFAARHFAEVVASEAWLSTPVNCVRQLLASDRMVVDGEARVYDAAIAWLRARVPPMGTEAAVSLLGLVRFPLLSREFFTGTVRAEPLLKTPAGLGMLADALTAPAFGGKTRRRIGFTQLYAVGGYDDRESRVAAVERYDPSTNTWEAVAAMSTKRANLGAVALDGKLYAVGGFDGETHLDSVERYDPSTNAWEAVAAMSTKRCGVGAVALDGKLYAVGGYTGCTPLDSVERYDPSTNTWEAVASMPTERDSLACIAA